MNASKMSIEEILYASGLRINNSLSDRKILDAVSPMGYPEAKLNEGAALLEETVTLVETQKKEYGEVDEAQSGYEAVRKTANQTYMDMLRIARVALKNDVKAITTLDLDGRRARTLSGWLKQTLGFYRAVLANDEWKAAMAAYGQPEEKFSAQVTAIEEVATASEAIKKEMGDAQNATLERDMKLEELVDWINDYEVIARIALADKPQLLEKLGIVVKA
ncbi:hypothetical protein SAMN05444274_102565 [Mariniphaga anaerophila]|uniref:Uncharacterized protein n=1 Tax=Mariniphaga anaerophila TaxID=1484053 RepID=A0A1M4WUX0_9BACT|nr:hypothetical protein [Mariniphaga anaerophila]SHE85010.1 hypothetical protein SAMN05444274_102565 [Mariniphaga anaerophila]